MVSILAPIRTTTSEKKEKVGLASLFFNKTLSTDDITKLPFIPEVDFSDTYTDWKLDEDVETFKKEYPEKYESVIERLDSWFVDHKFKSLHCMFNTFGGQEMATTGNKYL